MRQVCSRLFNGLVNAFAILSLLGTLARPSASETISRVYIFQEEGGVLLRRNSVRKMQCVVAGAPKMEVYQGKTLLAHGRNRKGLLYINIRKIQEDMYVGDLVFHNASKHLYGNYTCAAVKNGSKLAEATFHVALDVSARSKVRNPMKTNPHIHQGETRSHIHIFPEEGGVLLRRNSVRKMHCVVTGAPKMEVYQGKTLLAHGRNRKGLLYINIRKIQEDMYVGDLVFHNASKHLYGNYTCAAVKNGSKLAEATFHVALDVSVRKKVRKPANTNSPIHQGETRSHIHIFPEEGGVLLRRNSVRKMHCVVTGAPKMEVYQGKTLLAHGRNRKGLLYINIRKIQEDMYVGDLVFHNASKHLYGNYTCAAVKNGSKLAEATFHVALDVSARKKVRKPANTNSPIHQGETRSHVHIFPEEGGVLLRRNSVRKMHCVVTGAPKMEVYQGKTLLAHGRNRKGLLYINIRKIQEDMYVGDLVFHNASKHLYGNYTCAAVKNGSKLAEATFHVALDVSARKKVRKPANTNSPIHQGKTGAQIDVFPGKSVLLTQNSKRIVRCVGTGVDAMEIYRGKTFLAHGRHRRGKLYINIRKIQEDIYVGYLVFYNASKRLYGEYTCAAAKNGIKLAEATFHVARGVSARKKVRKPANTNPPIHQDLDTHTLVLPTRLHTRTGEAASLPPSSGKDKPSAEMAIDEGGKKVRKPANTNPPIHQDLDTHTLVLPTRLHTHTGEAVSLPASSGKDKPSAEMAIDEGGKKVRKPANTNPPIHQDLDTHRLVLPTRLHTRIGEAASLPPSSGKDKPSAEMAIDEGGKTVRKPANTNPPIHQDLDTLRLVLPTRLHTSTGEAASLPPSSGKDKPSAEMAIDEGGKKVRKPANTNPPIHQDLDTHTLVLPTRLHTRTGEAASLPPSSGKDKPSAEMAIDEGDDGNLQVVVFCTLVATIVFLAAALPVGLCLWTWALRRSHSDTKSRESTATVNVPHPPPTARPFPTGSHTLQDQQAGYYPIWSLTDGEALDSRPPSFCSTTSLLAAMPDDLGDTKKPGWVLGPCAQVAV